MARSAVPLFVYGTLMGGESTDFLLGADPSSRGPRRAAVVRARLYALPAGYPAIVLGGDALVHGELIDGIDDRRFGLLDQYEGVAEGLYQRTMTEVRVGLRLETAWVYAMAFARASKGRHVPNGRWRQLRRR